MILETTEADAIVAQRETEGQTGSQRVQEHTASWSQSGAECRSLAPFQGFSLLPKAA